jgi:alpha-glucosidase
MLSLYRMALLIRRTHPDLGAGTFHWLPTGTGDDHVLAFRRGDSFASVTNFGPDPVDLPGNDQIWLTSATLEGGRLPPDATAWLRPTS